jgi:ankyrin repeat protein
MQHLSSASWGFQLEKISLSVKRLVPDDSDIIRLCRGGNLVAVQQLLQEGRGSINDVTPLGLTPLMVSSISRAVNVGIDGLKCAIESGRLDLVQFLIVAGADVNAQLDHCNTQVP